MPELYQNKYVHWGSMIYAWQETRPSKNFSFETEVRCVYWSPINSNVFLVQMDDQRLFFVDCETGHRQAFDRLFAVTSGTNVGTVLNVVKCAGNQLEMRLSAATQTAKYLAFQCLMEWNGQPFLKCPEMKHPQVW
jgi:hypothetical protein